MRNTTYFDWLLVIWCTCLQSDSFRRAERSYECLSACDLCPRITVITKSGPDALNQTARYFRSSVGSSVIQGRRYESALIFAFHRVTPIKEHGSCQRGCQDGTVSCFPQSSPLRETLCTWHRKWRYRVRVSQPCSHIKCERRTSSLGNMSQACVRKRRSEAIAPRLRREALKILFSRLSINITMKRQ